MISDVVLENPVLIEANFKHGGAVKATMLSANLPQERKASRPARE